MRSRMWSAVALVSVLAFMLAGCGATPEPQVIEKIVTKEVEVVVTQEVEKVVTQEVEKVVTEQVEVVVTATPAPLGEGGVKVIPFMTTESDPESVAVFQEIIAEYEDEHPDVRIDLVLTAHGSEFERLVSAQSVGASLGIVGMHPDYVPQYVEAGWLLPLNDVVDAAGRDQFKIGSVLSVGGNDYALGYAMGQHHTLWVRQDLFDEAGLALPTTYDELLAAAKALTKDTDGDGDIDVYGIGLPAGANSATTPRFIPFVLQNCGDYFDKQGNLVFDNPNVFEGFKRYLELLQYSPPESSGWSQFDGITAYATGKIAMHPYGGRLGVNLAADKPELRKVSTVIYMPAGDKVKAGRGAWDYWGVSSSTPYPEEAKGFLTFFFTGDRLSRFLLTVPGHLVPPTKALEEQVLASDNPYVLEYKKDVETLFEASAYAIAPQVFMGSVDISTCTLDAVYNPNPWSGEVFDSYIDGQMIERVVVGGESPEEAWKWAYTEMGRIADEWKAEHPDWKPLAGE